MFSRIFTGIITLFLLVGCSFQDQKEIVQEQEIRRYLNNESWEERSGTEDINSEIDFWSAELSKNDTPIYKMKLASAYQQKFGLTKDVIFLAKAENLLIESNEFYSGKKTGVLQALAQLSITKHDFQTAINYAEDALSLGEDKLLSYMILFDASMETGDFEYAKYILDHEISNKSSFNYLIRNSQFQDYLGNADKSLSALEQGVERIQFNSGLSAWAQSNLGDRLGHEGNVPKAYELFKYALEQEQSGASYLHSLKGIAYIAFANDGNTEFAKEIMRFVSERTQSPDSYLFLADIAEFEGNESLKREWIDRFYKEASLPEYYGMYDAELIQIAAIEFGNFEVAEILVEKELVNRPSPITYDLKAWVKYHKGELQIAKEIVEKKVLGKTYEPVPAFHAGIILKEAGDSKKAKELLLAAKEANFELGPLVIKRINDSLD